jgi:hypothetical protein
MEQATLTHRSSGPWHIIPNKPGPPPIASHVVFAGLYTIMFDPRPVTSDLATSRSPSALAKEPSKPASSGNLATAELIP